MKTLLTILFINLIISTSGQTFSNKDIKAKKLFERAENYSKEYKSDSSLVLYEEILKLNIPDTVGFNINKISSLRLAQIYFLRNDYMNTVKYLDISEKVHDKIYMCGMLADAKKRNLVDRYSVCYIGLEKYKLAIDILTAYLFRNGLYDPEQKFENRLYDAYLKLYSKGQLKSEYLNMLRSLTIKDEVVNNVVYMQASIELFEQKINILDPLIKVNKFDGTINKESDLRVKCLNEIIHSELYKRVTAE